MVPVLSAMNANAARRNAVQRVDQFIQPSGSNTSSGSAASWARFRVMARLLAAVFCRSDSRWYCTISVATASMVMPMITVTAIENFKPRLSLVGLMASYPLPQVVEVPVARPP